MQRPNEADPARRGLLIALGMNRGEIDAATLERLLRRLGMLEPKPLVQK